MHDESEHDGGEFLGYASDTNEAIVEAIPIILHTGGDEPGAGGSGVVGEQHTGHEDGETKGDPPVEAGLQPSHGLVHGAGERDFGLGRLFALRVFSLESLASIVLRFLLLFVLRLRAFGFRLGHPWLS